MESVVILDSSSRAEACKGVVVCRATANLAGAKASVVVVWWTAIIVARAREEKMRILKQYWLRKSLDISVFVWFYVRFQRDVVMDLAWASRSIRECFLGWHFRRLRDLSRVEASAWIGLAKDPQSVMTASDWMTHVVVNDDEKMRTG